MIGFKRAGILETKLTIASARPYEKRPIEATLMSRNALYWSNCNASARIGGFGLFRELCEEWGPERWRELPLMVQRMFKNPYKK